MLSVAEVFYYSSNIGSARLAQKFSVESQREYLSRMGQLDLLDAAPFLTGNEPLFPKNWSRLSSLTISFGHGIAATPLQAGIAIAALVNGGRLIKPTLVKRDAAASDAAGKQVISAKTSENIRYLLRRGAEIGAAKTVDVDGYYVGGVPATGNKVVGGKYSKEKVHTTFISAFPMDKPQYLLLVMLDEPQGNVQTQGYKTSAWNAGEITGRIIERVAPILGIERRPLPSTDPFPNSTKATGQRASVPGIQASAAD